MLDKLYNTAEIAELMHKKPSTIRTYIRQGLLGDTYNDGQAHLVYESNLRKFLKSHTDPADGYSRQYTAAKHVRHHKYIPEKYDNGLMKNAIFHKVQLPILLQAQCWRKEQLPYDLPALHNSTSCSANC